jgi:hypothetical protein
LELPTRGVCRGPHFFDSHRCHGLSTLASGQEAFKLCRLLRVGFGKCTAEPLDLLDCAGAFSIHSYARKCQYHVEVLHIMRPVCQIMRDAHSYATERDYARF